MNIIAKPQLLKAASGYGSDAVRQISIWYHEVKAASWSSFVDVRKSYPTADAVGKEGVVFNICGNRFRLIVNCCYESQTVWFKFFGNHAEYDRLNVVELCDAYLRN